MAAPVAVVYSGPWQVDSGGGPISFTSPDVFDLSQCDIVVEYNLNIQDLSALGQWSTVGLRSDSANGFMRSARINATVADPNVFDPEDELVLGTDTRPDVDTYDVTGPDTVETPPLGDTANSPTFNILFDRDSAGPGYTWPDGVDGVYDNTAGLYKVTITYHAISDTEATMIARINGINQGIYDNTASDTEPDNFPVGKTIDSGDISAMQLVMQLSGAGTIVGPVTVTGCLAETPVEMNVVQKKLNCRSHGVVPVVIYGSDTLDVSDIDRSTVELEGAPILSVGHGSHTFFLAVMVDMNRDGMPDLLMLFDMDAMDLSGLQDGTADLQGQLTGGEAFVASDEVELLCPPANNNHITSNQGSTRHGASNRGLSKRGRH